MDDEPPRAGVKEMDMNIWNARVIVEAIEDLIEVKIAESNAQHGELKGRVEDLRERLARRISEACAEKKED